MNKINTIVFPYLNTVFFPHTYMPITLQLPEHVSLVKAAIMHKMPLAILWPASGKGKDAGPESKALELNRLNHPQGGLVPNICALANPIMVNDFGNGSIQVLLLGIGKGKISSVSKVSQFLFARVDLSFDSEFESYGMDHPDIQAIYGTLKDWIVQQILAPKYQEVILSKMMTVNAILDYACLFLLKDSVTKKIFLEENSMKERVELLKRLILKDKENTSVFFSVALQEFESMDENAAPCWS